MAEEENKKLFNRWALGGRNFRLTLKRNIDSLGISRENRFHLCLNSHIVIHDAPSSFAHHLMYSVWSRFLPNMRKIIELRTTKTLKLQLYARVF